MITNDTIVATATAPGRAGVAVTRVSGTRARDVITALCGRLPEARKATRFLFRDPGTGDVLDDGLVLWFPGPASFTGEDTAEFQGHGGKAVTDALLQTIRRMDGVRIAEPGEFSRRAFLNGKLDLTRVEGLADLIQAETDAQRRQALQQMDGALARLYDSWREELVRRLAWMEAHIDFPDEDIPPDLDRSARNGLEELAQTIDAYLSDNRRGERIRDGIQIAVIGRPNAGKSSLVNALAQREAAIVSDQAGTTRDIIEIHLDLGGFPVTIADTAGLRSSNEDIEAEGIRRARVRASTADLKIAVFDLTEWPELDEETLSLVDSSTLIVLNKSDVATPYPDRMLTISGSGAHSLLLSTRSGEGMTELLSTLTAMVAERLNAGAHAPPALTRQRHRDALEDCRDSLLRAIHAPMLELMVEDVRLAARALGRITGRVEVDDLLDVIFSDFCIGK
ncbi:tRNA uridine-5-carboxymethylaminomethyl(34) synthesis GTPase MnmE [Haematospirillum jordaniae]|nr:tRNA uridine-5-carboxymethylaminomethyl(34) synthesis GTPase MnmE [Haematospirillum jordaniae]